MSGSALEVAILGVGLAGPGLPSWAASRTVLRGEVAYRSEPTVVPAPARLPPAERRRASPSVRLAMTVADEAVAAAGIDPSTLATVFAASSGEGSNCHALCETLAGPDRLISPTRFTNSVHNAAAGYWHIAVASRAASTSLSAYDASFAAGLLEAASQCRTDDRAVLLVAFDVEASGALASVVASEGLLACALVLAPSAGSTSVCTVDWQVARETVAAPALRSAAARSLAGNAMAGALPMLEAIATADRGDASLALPIAPALALRLTARAIVVAQARP